MKSELVLGKLISSGRCGFSFNVICERYILKVFNAKCLNLQVQGAYFSDSFLLER